LWLLAVVGVVIDIGHLKTEERKVGAGKFDFAECPQRLVGGRRGLTMVRSNGFVQTVASLTANLNRMAAVADRMPGIDSSW
jgi:hypothetical protein